MIPLTSSARKKQNQAMKTSKEAASGREMSGKGHVGNLRDDENILYLSGGKVTWV